MHVPRTLLSNYPPMVHRDIARIIIDEYDGDIRDVHERFLSQDDAEIEYDIDAYVKDSFGGSVTADGEEPIPCNDHDYRSVVSILWDEYESKIGRR